MQVTSQKPTIGRILHVYCPSLWSGPQPGIVTGGPWDEPLGPDHEMHPHANVNCFVDAANNPKALVAWRESPSGNTLCSIPVLDAMTDDDRARFRVYAGIGRWAEWPPRA